MMYAPPTSSHTKCAYPHSSIRSSAVSAPITSAISTAVETLAAVSAATSTNCPATMDIASFGCPALPSRPSMTASHRPGTPSVSSSRAYSAAATTSANVDGRRACERGSGVERGECGGGDGDRHEQHPVATGNLHGDFGQKPTSLGFGNGNKGGEAVPGARAVGAVARMRRLGCACEALARALSVRVRAWNARHAARRSDLWRGATGGARRARAEAEVGLEVATSARLAKETSKPGVALSAAQRAVAARLAAAAANATAAAAAASSTALRLREHALKHRCVLQDRIPRRGVRGRTHAHAPAAAAAAARNASPSAVCSHLAAPVGQQALRLHNNRAARAAAATAIHHRAQAISAAAAVAIPNINSSTTIITTTSIITNDTITKDTTTSSTTSFTAAITTPTTSSKSLHLARPDPVAPVAPIGRDEPHLLEAQRTARQHVHHAAAAPAARAAAAAAQKPRRRPAPIRIPTDAARNVTYLRTRAASAAVPSARTSAECRCRLQPRIKRAL
eukprot:5127743-Pleurochrysis_carterae.AAC.1